MIKNLTALATDIGSASTMHILESKALAKQLPAGPVTGLNIANAYTSLENIEARNSQDVFWGAV